MLVQVAIGKQEECGRQVVGAVLLEHADHRVARHQAILLHLPETGLKLAAAELKLADQRVYAFGHGALRNELFNADPSHSVKFASNKTHS